MSDADKLQGHALPGVVEALRRRKRRMELGSPDPHAGGGLSARQGWFLDPGRHGPGRARNTRGAVLDARTRIPAARRRLSRTGARLRAPRQQRGCRPDGGLVVDALWSFVADVPPEASPERSMDWRRDAQSFQAR